jgi:hypothetical protein
VLCDQFAAAELVAEIAPDLKHHMTLTRQLFATTVIDTAPRPWTGGAENNIGLIEALKSYAPHEQPGGGYSVTAPHTLERWYVRAVELYACWQSRNPICMWGPAPDYAVSDRAVI